MGGTPKGRLPIMQDKMVGPEPNHLALLFCAFGVKPQRKWTLTP